MANQGRDKMAYQTCPICGGSGIEGIYVQSPCTVCNGKRIIDEKTGRPP